MTATTVQVICPNVHCRFIQQHPEESRGRVVTCPRCKVHFSVPKAKEVPDPMEKRD